MVRRSLMAVMVGVGALAACQTTPVPDPAPAAVPAQAPAPEAPWREVAAENLVILQTVTGAIVIELAPEAAPAHVAQAGLEFEHRLDAWDTVPLEADRTVEAAGFVPLGNADLFAPEAGHRNGFAVGRDGKTEWLLHCPGALGMARDTPPDSGATEFFIPIGQRRYLDRNYTIFGRVISGMEHVNRLERVEPAGEAEIPAFTDPATAEAAFAARAQALSANRILSIGLAADMPEDLRPRWEVMATPGVEWEALKTSKRDYGIYDAFVVTPPKRLDICTLPVPARPVHAD